jgi:hypothetical protein
MAVSLDRAPNIAALPAIQPNVISIETEDSSIYEQHVLYTPVAERTVTDLTATRDWSILGASFVPVRTDTPMNFITDLTFPTLINHALKVNNLFSRFLSIIAAFIWDILTMSIRIVATPFRLTYTHCIREKNHPLAQLIPQDALIPNGFVKIVKTTRYFRRQIEFPSNRVIPDRMILETRREERVISLVDQSSHANYEKTLVCPRSQFYQYSAAENCWVDRQTDCYGNIDGDHYLSSQEPL